MDAQQDAGGENVAETGPGSAGSLGTGTYDDTGNLTGPDSPAGEKADLDAHGEGQGDDLANRLGGGQGRGVGLSGGGAATGDMSAASSERADAGEEPVATDPGGPGGMGGVRSAGGTGIGRPPGGVSPIQAEEEAGGQK